MEIAAGDPRRLNLQDIIAEARAQTGLTDMGEPDVTDGLTILVDALIREANLSPAGVEMKRAGLIGLVSNRLRIQEQFRLHPEILQEKIRAPIVIVGLPRSGTTKLQKVLTTNPDLQWLPLWKVLNPAPLGPIPPGGEDPRIAIAEQISAYMRDNFPDFYSGHPMNAREAEEEIWMQDMSLRGWGHVYAAKIPTFEAWTEKQDFETWYVFLRKLLQLIQWHDGSPNKRWLLKAPEHMAEMELLFKTFPDATVVHCHRDPTISVASLAVLTVASRGMYTDEKDHLDSGRFTLNHWASHTRAYLQQRKRLESKHRFVDVSYKEITSNIMAAVDRINAAAGLKLTPANRAAVIDWEKSNPPGKPGARRYSLSDVGLTEKQVRDAFADYLEQFRELVLY
jgi:Sulfotransferase family